MKSPDAATAANTFMTGVRERNPNQPEFHQAVEELVTSVMPYYLTQPDMVEAKVLERLTEPDRIISFRVCWEDDNNQVQINRAWRVQFNNSIGPYKGGLRFHPSVNESVLKFLGFEQCFKNALTGLPMGGAKGGSNFDPKGKSDHEVMRFCQALMTELCRHIGEDVDVPAGDIGVGAREIGYMFGQYQRVQNRWAGVLTGKGRSYGGSLIRPEATGYGLVYMTEDALAARGQTYEGKTISVSGSGNVATFATERATQMGAKVVTLSDSGGFIHDPDGIDADKLAWVRELKEVRRGRISEYANEFPSATYTAGKRPWAVPVDIAFPCATENELDANDAAELVKNGCAFVGEGANMPSTNEAVSVLQAGGVTFLPGKAANAGGVAVSGLEQSQNSLRFFWDRDNVDQRLRQIMTEIHESCVEYGTTDGGIDYVVGANVAGFRKLADTLTAYGVV